LTDSKLQVGPEGFAPGKFIKARNRERKEQARFSEIVSNAEPARTDAFHNIINTS
jgi:hypothetical protein